MLVADVSTSSDAFFRTESESTDDGDGDDDHDSSPRSVISQARPMHSHESLHLCNLRGQAEETPQHKDNENRTGAKSGRSDRR